uniref:Peptidase S1 domain-containing protein n=1 Tax=Glossina brevipalpis TaxID=37001 RepID=A0A1A9WS69_9MUSC
MYVLFSIIIIIQTFFLLHAQTNECKTDLLGYGWCIAEDKCKLFQMIKNELKTSLICGTQYNENFYCCPKCLADDLPQNRDDDDDDDAQSEERSPRNVGITCGQMLTPRISGGTNTSIVEFPWSVLVEYAKEDGTKGHFCGGTLIASKWVLTAAHCIKDTYAKNLQVTGVRLGEWNTDTNPDCQTDIRGHKDCAPPYVDISVDRVLMHNSFNISLNGVRFDIALLRLSSSVTYTDFIKPICLPLNDSLRSLDFIDYSLIVAGWGHYNSENVMSSILQKATLNVVPHRKCNLQFRKYYITLSKDEICAEGSGIVDTCFGDSGGPLMYEDYGMGKKAQWYLVGITSFGRVSCGTGSLPSIYTRVSEYTNWILDTIKNNLN